MRREPSNAYSTFVSFIDSPRSRIFSCATRWASISRCCCLSFWMTSSRVARRRTTCEEFSGGWRRSATSCATRVTVPIACPSCESTTTRSPGPNSSTIRSGSRNDTVRPAGVNFTLTKGRWADMVGLSGFTLYVQRDPVCNDLRARVAVERRQRAIDRLEGADRPVAVEGSADRLELHAQVGVGQDAIVRAGKQQPQIPHERGERQKTPRQFVAIPRAREHLGAVEAAPRIRRCRGGLQQACGGVARVHGLVGAALERAADAAP